MRLYRDPARSEQLLLAINSVSKARDNLDTAVAIGWLVEVELAQLAQWFGIFSVQNAERFAISMKVVDSVSILRFLSVGILAAVTARQMS